MLEKPVDGWSFIKIGSFQSRISYLTNVPFDCLNACMSSLKYNLPVSIYFDAEGWEFIISSSYENTFIIVDDENRDTDLITIQMNSTNFVKEIVHDIECNLDEWSLWNISCDSMYEENKKNLAKLIDDLKSILKEKYV